MGNDTDLVLEARGGNHEAFDRLAECHRPALVRACRRRLGSADEAEDAAQEALVRAFRALPRLLDAGRFRPWLHRIAANVCRDRGTSAPDVGPLPEEVPAPSLPEADPLLCRAVHDAVASLPPDLQVVIALYHLEALSFAEIAGRLGLPATTIKGRLNRGRELLRKEMLRMGMGTDSDKITFAPTRVGLLLAPATPYGATGEDAPSLGRLLTSAGFATSAVPPERAVASLRRTIPQILVVADDVPGVDAFALIRDLRSEHRTRGIALVLLLHPDAASGKMDEDALYRAWQAGVDCLLSLPCAPAELVEFVRRIDRKARAQQCMVIATDLGWRGEATDCLRYLRAALQMGGEEIREEVRRNVAFRRLARSVEFRDLVGEEPRET